MTLNSVSEIQFFLKLNVSNLKNAFGNLKICIKEPLSWFPKENDRTPISRHS